jgi:hypothetical protein
MKKIIGIILIFSLLLMMSGCSQPKEIRFKDGSVRTVVPYGFINELSQDGKRNDDVVYKISTKDIVLSIIFCETIIVPIISLGYNLWEPVGAIEK